MLWVEIGWGRHVPPVIIKNNRSIQSIGISPNAGRHTDDVLQPVLVGAVQFDGGVSRNALPSRQRPSTHLRVHTSEYTPQV